MMAAAFKMAKPQRIMAVQMVEIVYEPDVRKMVGDADQFDTVAPVGSGCGVELGFQQRDGFIFGVPA